MKRRQPSTKSSLNPMNGGAPVLPYAFIAMGGSGFGFGSTGPSSRRTIARVGVVLMLGLLGYCYGGTAQNMVSGRMEKYQTILNPLSVHCASPWKPTLPVDSALQHSPEDCHPIESSHPDFSLQICVKPDACNAFSVLISRLDKSVCAAMESRSNMTTDPELLGYIKGTLGPDSFLLRTSGSQRWASELSRYEGECGYRFDVSLSNGGEVWLELWHNFEEYNAFDELDTRDWAPLLHTPLLPEPLRLAICAPSCPTYYSPRLKASDTGNTFSTRPSHDSLVFDPIDLPRCGGHEHPEGLYLPWHPMDRVDPPAPLIQSRTTVSNLSVVGNYNYIPATCSLKSAGNQFRTDHSGCTGKKAEVAFFGDSHSRFVLHGWQYRLAGNTDFYPEKQKDVYDRSQISYDQSTYHFMWAPHWHEFLGVMPEDWQALSGLVVSHGAWGAMEGETTSSMLTNWGKIMDYIDESTKDHPIKNKVFMTPAPYPPQSIAPSRRERRTNVWLGYWNKRMIELVTERGWKVIDQYSIGMPVMLEMLAADGLHLSPGEAHSPVVDLSLLQTDIC